MSVNHCTLAKPIDLSMTLHTANHGTGVVVMVNAPGYLMKITLEAQHACCLQLSRTVGLSHTDEQWGRDAIVIPLNKEAAHLTSVGVVSVEEQPSVHKHGGKRFYSGCFLHILSESEHGAEGHFADLLSLTQERICFSHGSKAPGSLAWLCAGQTGVIHSGFHWLPTTCHSIFT